RLVARRSQRLFPRSRRALAGTRNAGAMAHLLGGIGPRTSAAAGTKRMGGTWPSNLWEARMAEAEQHRPFVKRLHTLVHSELAEDERRDLARRAVLSYAAALNEAAAVAPQGDLREGAYIELHLTKAQNWLVAWRSLSDPVDPSTARVCDTAMRAL